MKKRILAFMMCLCMMVVILPVNVKAEGDTDPLENVTFNYAYDAQRSPAFPDAVGSTLTFSSLYFPLDENGNNMSVNEGSWTLTRAGTYSFFVGTGNVYLEGIVNSVANKYHISDDEKKGIVIHELKKDDSHIAYGVVIAYGTTDENKLAAFLGDKWSYSGAGYLLSQSEQTGSVTVTATQIATDFTSTAIDYRITATAGENGTISPSGDVKVTDGNNQEFTITPNSGYEIDTLKVDGADVTLSTSYTFTVVNANHTIEVTFKPISQNPGGDSGNSGSSSSSSGSSSGSSGSSSSSSGSSSGNSASESSTAVKDMVPKTGETTPIAWLFVLALISGTGMMVTGRKGKKSL